MPPGRACDRRRAHRRSREAAAGELERLERRWEDRRRESERRHTRKAFLTGAAAVGWKGRADADDSGYGSGSRDRGAGGGGAGNSGTSRASGGNASAGSGASARFAVDSGRCVGCGACLQMCPAGVLAASGGGVTAQYPDACRLCERCTQVCRPSAITPNA